MIKERWSPYLTALDGTAINKKATRSVTYALSKERKNVVEQLQLMKIRIKQLEKEEKRAKLKAINASSLADTIIERRVERKNQNEYKHQLKKLRQQELEELRERNREMKEDIRSSIAFKKGLLLENKKILAKEIKTMQMQRKLQTSLENPIKSASSSPRPSHLSSKNKSLDKSLSRIEEEKNKTNEALNEMKKLEALEQVLIDKLKQAYENQKSAENQVNLLMSNPVILSRQELSHLSSQNFSVVSN
ncbi:hypothetical protein SteCoe_7179 [Stentor coeruleus]|uniref:Uncharacterized protein n=1 Tax=Stentor coeruleus TaxID=5963 RepID=A0A1R2CND3_9CILI|nr:hypothetical protein SteCoe_7179 [Stentor coeruleus]